jgi:hypothetical protein
MTFFTQVNPDGSRSTGSYHPELAEASLGCLKRDLKQLRRTKGKPFLRRPYNDLSESEIIALNPASPSSALIAGVGVYPIVIGDTNARIPMTNEQVQEALRKGEIVDCWTRKGFAG